MKIAQMLMLDSLSDERDCGKLRWVKFTDRGTLKIESSFFSLTLDKSETAMLCAAVREHNAKEN